MPVATATGTAEAGKWSVAGATMPIVSDVRWSALPDASSGLTTRSAIGQQLIDVWDGSNTGRPFARNCLAFWNVAGVTCGHPHEGSRPFVGHTELHPERIWFDPNKGGTHGWTVAADDLHFAFVQFHIDDGAQTIKGITYYW